MGLRAPFLFLLPILLCLFIFNKFEGRMQPAIYLFDTPAVQDMQLKVFKLQIFQLDSPSSWGQFHQHSIRSFYVRNLRMQLFCSTFQVCTLLGAKATRGMLMKLSPDCTAQSSNFLGGYKFVYLLYGILSFVTFHIKLKFLRLQNLVSSLIEKGLFLFNIIQNREGKKSTTFFFFSI